MTLTRSQIPRSNSNASVPTADHTSKGGLAMPAVAVLQHKGDPNLPGPFYDEKLSLEGHPTSEKTGSQEHIQRFSLNNSNSGINGAEQSAVKPFQLQSTMKNEPAAADRKEPFRTKPLVQKKDLRGFNTGAIPVVQLAALAEDKLNVVGEDHEESKPRLRKEFDLSVAKTRSPNFWPEMMFKIDWTGVHQLDENKNTRGADPTLERVRYLMAKFSMNLDSAFSNLDLLVPEQVDDLLPPLTELNEPDDLSLGEQQQSNVGHSVEPDHSSLPVEQELPGIEDNVELDDIDLDEELKKDLFKSVLALAETTQDLHTQIDIAVTEEFYKHLHYLDHEDSPDTNIAPVMRILKAAEELRDMAAAAKIVPPEELREALTRIAHKGKELHDRCQDALWIHPRDNQVINSPASALDDTKEQRSMVMHLAANKNHTVTGVWKVGEQHVQDILGFSRAHSIGPINYNLLSRGEFQEIYNEHYPTSTTVSQQKSDVKQFVAVNDHARQENTLQTGQVGQLAVIQCMYEDAEDDIDLILCTILQTFDNNARALAISELPELDKVTQEELDSVLTVLRSGHLETAATLRAALENGNAEFAQALLTLIANPPQLENENLLNTETSAKDFETLIREALAIHVPNVGRMIDEAQERALHSGKKLLVIVGEGHEDPYSRVMVTILVGALQRLKANRFYIELTPDQVTQHVEPYKHQVPMEDDSGGAAHQRHFFHHLYQQGATVTGVDIYKKTAMSGEVNPKTLESISEVERTKLQAAYAEENVKRRNVGIAQTVASYKESGVMLVGLSHLAGLGSDETIRSVYEIVTISTMLKEEARGHNEMVYGRMLNVTTGLFGMENLYEGNAPEMPGEHGLVTAKDAFAIAEQMVIEVNQQ